LLSPRRAALLIATGIFVIGWLYGSKGVGGADEYGYLSEANLWLHGPVREPMRFREEPGWQAWAGGLAPLGYWMNPSSDGYDMVPSYPPGLPFMLAAAKVVAGETGAYAVAPLCGAMLVLVTFGLGRRLVSDGAGLVAAALLASSPLLLSSVMTVMSDAPAALCWAAAFYLALNASYISALGAGLLVGLAVLVRPSLTPLVAIPGLFYMIELAARATRVRGFWRALLYAAGVALGGAILAAVNASVYGSPFLSSYGDVRWMFAQDHIWPNVRNYAAWFVESHTPFMAIGLAALVIPSRRLWPGAGARRAVIVSALFALGLWLVYLPYLVFDGWGFLRFMLPAWPFMMVGWGAVVMALWRAEWGVLRAAALAAVLALATTGVLFARGHSVFDLWQSAQRYVVAGAFAGRLTEPGSVIVCMQHSGSVRYYGGRMTVRYDMLVPGAIDDLLSWFAARGTHVYLLAENWEMPRVREAFAGARAAELLDRAPIGVFSDPGEIVVMDLSRQLPPDERPQKLVGVKRHLTAGLPAPPAHWSFAQ
jgi:4-amino-4-deoxy-L-arabinose transferase-like glycosyltransferase